MARDFPACAGSLASRSAVSCSSQVVLELTIAVDGKLFCVDGSFSVRYDPQSNTWTEVPGPPRMGGRRCSCVHNGRIVAFYHDGAAFERANDGSWSPYQAVADVDALDHRSLACFGSVLLG